MYISKKITKQLYNLCEDTFFYYKTFFNNTRVLNSTLEHTLGA